MSSQPVSVRNKSSKFTLTKKEFYENITKIGNNAIVIKSNIGSYFPSEFSQYKKTSLKKNNKNKTQNSNRFSLKSNNNTIDKSKKDFNTINTDFLKLFRQFDILKKNKTSNKTAIEASLKEKQLRSIYAPSVSNSKSKGKKNQKQNNNSKPQKQNSKNKNIKINSNYEPNNKNILINNINSYQRNVILTNHNKNKKINVNYPKNNKFPRKTFKTFNPFHIKFAKPINSINKNKIKQSNITTYQINFSKLIPNKIHSLQNNVNKTQEINNTSKTLKNNENNKKSNKESYHNSNSNINNNKKSEKQRLNNNNSLNLNNNNININANILINQNKTLKEEEININQLKKEIDYLDVNQNISDIDLVDERDNYYNNNDDDEEESENSGVLAYDEVRDIIVYYDMGDLTKKQNYLFEKDDYKIFLNNKKHSYLNFFMKNNMNDENNNQFLKINENKKQNPPTNDTNKDKKKIS